MITATDRTMIGKAIMQAVHGAQAGNISGQSNRCEELFERTILAGIERASCPPAHPNAVDAEAYYEAVTNGISIALRYGNINVSVSREPVMCMIDFGSHSYKPGDPEILTIQNHLAKKGFQVSVEGTKLSFRLTDPEHVAALQAFESAQKERSTLIPWKS